MNRREMIKTTASGAGALVLTRVLPLAGLAGATAFLASCGERVLAMLSVVMNVVGQAGALFGELGLPKGVEIAGKIAAIAKKVDESIRGKKFKNALEFLNEIIKSGGLFDEILVVAGIAKNDLINKALVIAKFALSVIAGLIVKGVEGQTSLAESVGASTDQIDNVKKWAAIDPTSALRP